MTCVSFVRALRSVSRCRPWDRDSEMLTFVNSGLGLLNTVLACAGNVNRVLRISQNCEQSGSLSAIFSLSKVVALTFHFAVTAVYRGSPRQPGLPAYLR